MPPGAAWIRLHLDIGWCGWAYVEVDEHPTKIDKPGTLVTVGPGWHRVTCSVEGKGECGRVSLDVLTHPGQVVDVFYCGPRTIYSRGAIGFVPQKRRWAIDWDDSATVFAIAITVVVLVLWILSAVT